MTGMLQKFCYYIKEGYAKDCNSYRGLTLTSIAEKNLTRILENRLREDFKTTTDETLHFRKERSTQDAIFLITQTGEKLLRKNKEMHVCFMDLRKA